MSNIVTLIALFIFVFLCSVACLLIYYGMISGIQSKHDRNVQVSYFDRDVFGVIQKHRQLFPKSRLPAALLITLGISVFGTFLLFVLRSQS